MAEAQQKATFDAFFETDETYSSPVPTWFEVLNTEKNRRGLREISVQAYRGRAGYATLASLTVRMPNGADAASDDTPDLTEKEVTGIVGQAYEIASRAAKRDGYTVFRFLLRCVRKNRSTRSETMTDGEYATVSIDPVTGNVGIDPRIAEVSNSGKDPRDRLIDMLVTHINSILGSVTSNNEVSQKTLLSAIELGDRLETRRHEIEERAAEVASREHPEQQTQQFMLGLQFAAMEIDTLMKVYLMSKLGPQAAEAWAREQQQKREQWTRQSAEPSSSTPPSSSAAPSPPPTPSQNEVCRWYAELAEDKRTALEDTLGEDRFGSFYDGIHASAEDWPECARLLARFVEHNATDLIAALGDDLRDLCKLLGASMVG